jgi:cellulose synthase/poly-beta-1,6-N-acetylglucosamine synthase-like glycosyltransferase
MLGAMITVAAVIPTYNGRAFIERAIDSALAQEEPADEIVVVDDASSDGTADFVAERFPQVRLMRLERNVGSGQSRNAGVAATASELIAFLDHDDAWEPGYLACQRRALAAAPGAVLNRTALTMVDSRTGTRSVMGAPEMGGQDEAIRLLLVGRSLIATLSIVAVRRAAFDRVGGFDPALKVANDRDLYLKLARIGAFSGSPGALVTKYLHGGNLLFEKDGGTWLAEQLAILDRFFADPANERFRPLETAARAWAHRRVESAVAAQRARR